MGRRFGKGVHALGSVEEDQLLACSCRTDNYSCLDNLQKEIICLTTVVGGRLRVAQKLSKDSNHQVFFVEIESVWNIFMTNATFQQSHKVCLKNEGD